MSRRRRNAYSSYYGSRGGSRGLADWFGLLALLCMLVCSVILLVRVLGAGVLTTVLTVVLILVLVLLNGLHAFVQLPVRRNVWLRRTGSGVCTADRERLFTGLVHGRRHAQFLASGKRGFLRRHRRVQGTLPAQCPAHRTEKERHRFF